MPSPSDFGFHNILCEDGRLNFVDFEYAGIDDLAKSARRFFAYARDAVIQSA